jgi:hypothetical protein
VILTLRHLCFTQAYSHSRNVHQLVTGVAEKGSSSVIYYWIQEPSSKVPAERRPQMAKKRVLEMVLSTVVIALGLAIFATFRDQRPQYFRHIESPPERWLPWAWSRGNNGYEVRHVPAHLWEFQDGDDDQEGRLHVGLDDGEL